MDIRQLRYFTAIVESNYNLLETSKKLHISQPALSQTITSFEQKENVALFERAGGRLQGLTEAGLIFYDESKALLKQYDKMMRHLREASSHLKGRLKIGVPPLILSLVFPDIMRKLITQNPDIQIEIIELGAYDLRKELILKEVDIAILLSPTNLNSDGIEELPLVKKELCVFVDANHELTKKEVLNWEDLQAYPMATFDASFMIHHLLIAAFNTHQISPHLAILSKNWDFLLRSTLHSDFVTILPEDVATFFSDSRATMRRLNHPVPWEIVMCRHHKKTYTNTETYVYEEIATYFKK